MMLEEVGNEIQINFNKKDIYMKDFDFLFLISKFLIK